MAYRYVWTGAVSSNGIRILAVFDAPIVARLRYGPVGGSRSILTEDVASSKEDVVTWDLSELDVGTEYQFRIEVAGQAIAESTGSFRTAPEPAHQFAFAAGSCVTNYSNSLVFDAIRNRRPLFLAHLGDFHYQDIAANDPAQFRYAVEAQAIRPRLSRLLRQVPIAYIPDDHDGASTGGTDGRADRESPNRAALLSAYRQIVPHFPLSDNPDDSLFQSWSVGRVRFILTDQRTSADPDAAVDSATKSMLGERQKAWFKSEILAAVSNPGIAFIVWLCPRVWHTRAHLPGRTWAVFAHEREELADFIAASGAGAMGCIIAGDGHHQGIESGTPRADYSTLRNGGMSWPVFQVAPLDQRPSSQGATGGPGGPFDIYEGWDRSAFGWLEVTDTGAGPLQFRWSTVAVDPVSGVETVRGVYTFASRLPDPSGPPLRPVPSTVLVHDGRFWRDGNRLAVWDGEWRTSSCWTIDG